MNPVSLLPHLVRWVHKNDCLNQPTKKETNKQTNKQNKQTILPLHTLKFRQLRAKVNYPAQKNLLLVQHPETNDYILNPFHFISSRYTLMLRLDMTYLLTAVG